jgi:hypothetical protein
MNGNAGTEVGSLQLGGSARVDQFWIQGSTLIGPDSGNSDVGFWPYPYGGGKTGKVKLKFPLAATVSLAPSSKR